MEFRSIVFLFMVISVIVVNLFGYAAGRGTAASRRLQSSPTMNSKNLFAQRLRRGAVKPGQTRRRRQEGGDSNWPGQEEFAQPSEDVQPSYFPAAVNERRGNDPYFGRFQQPEHHVPINLPESYRSLNNYQIQNDQASGSNPIDDNVVDEAPNGYDNPQSPTDSDSKKK